MGLKEPGAPPARGTLTWPQTFEPFSIGRLALHEELQAQLQVWVPFWIERPAIGVDPKGEIVRCKADHRGRMHD